MNPDITRYRGFILKINDYYIMSYAIFRDKNLRPENIKKGVKIFRTVGTLEESAVIVNEDIIANSSTASQSFTAGDGYDGIGLFTLLPYVLDSKTVNSSTAEQIVTSDHDGLSSVTVNPYTLDTKVVDPSTSQITVNSSADGLSSVTVNAVTSSIDSNIISSNIKNGVSILGVKGSYGDDFNWIAKARRGEITDLSPYTMKASRPYGYAYALYRAGMNKGIRMTDFPRVEISGKDYGLNNALAYFHIVKSDNNTLHIYGNNPGSYELAYFMKATKTDPNAYSDNLAVVFDELTTINLNNAVFSHCFDGLKTLTTVSFPLLTSVSGNIIVFYNMFSDCTALTTVNFPELTSLSTSSTGSNSNFAYWFYGSSITSINFPKLTTWSGDRHYTFPSTVVTAYTPYLNSYTSTNNSPIHELENVTTITTHPGCLKGNDENTNFYWWSSKVTSLSLSDIASEDVRLDNMGSLDRDSIVNVLQHLDTNTSGKTCTFFTKDNGLIIVDDLQHSVQGIYDNAVAAGWTINNLTIYDPNFLVTSPSSKILILNKDNKITFDALGNWTATVSNPDIQLDAYSGSAGTNQTVTVSMNSGFTGPATVTFSCNGVTVAVTVKYVPVTYVNYVSMPSARNVQVILDDEFNKNSCVEFDIMTTSTDYMQIGNNRGYTSGGVYLARLILFYSGGHLFDYPDDSGSKRVTIPKNKITIGNRFTLELDQYNGGTYQTKATLTTLSGTESYLGGTYSSDTSGHGHKFGLFNSYCVKEADQGYATVGFRIYGFKWYEYIDGVKTLIHDLKPVIDSNNVAGFYDEVTGLFISPSQGTLDYA